MHKESLIVKMLWVILVVAVCYFIWVIHIDKRYFEHFNSESDIYSRVIKIYYDNLSRSPNSEELKMHKKDIQEGVYDYNELELRLINSDEYQRLIKTQQNSLLPETTRILEEKDLIERIKKIYMKVRTIECPTELYLPLKDLYIYFKYNMYKFVALLRDTKYIDFEDKIKTTNNLSRESLIEMYLATFDDSKLNYDASAIEEMDMSLPVGSRLIDYLTSTEPYNKENASKVNGIALLSYLMKNIKEEEYQKKKREEEERLKQLQEASAELEKQRKMLVSSAGKNSCTTTQRLYLPNESKILKTDQGVQILQKLPPVCVPIGKPNEIPEIVVYNGLQGTNLEDAKNTQVGSIMPQFEYRRYIEIPTAGTTIPPQ